MVGYSNVGDSGTKARERCAQSGVYFTAVYFRLSEISCKGIGNIYDSLFVLIHLYLPAHLPVCLSVYPCCSHLEHRASIKRFVSLQFLNLRQSVGLLVRGINPTQGRYLHRTTQIQNKRTQTAMPRVGFKPKIPAFERAKTVRVLDRTATVVGLYLS
jgi:hypothetical protein